MYLEMLCKESIVTWFKDLTSFKRIDVMCNLLQSCQPFETRFLGTCIEELGRKDFTLLRQIENIVNNPAELSTQDLNNINDKETRSKLSKFLCVLHSTNKRCANELYLILMSLYEDINNIIKSGALLSDDSSLDEILLIYALGIFHPAFSFDKKMYLGDLLARLMQEEERIHLFKQKAEMMSPESYPSDNIAMAQVLDPLPNQGPEEPMSNISVLSYPAVMSRTSSPSGSPPIRSKPPTTPADHKPVSPNPLRLMGDSELPPPPGLGMPPPGMKETRLLTNGKPSEEANMRRQAYVVPVFYTPSPTPPPPAAPPSSCTSCLHNGGGTVTPGSGGSGDQMRDLRLGDQMRDLRLGELRFAASEGDHYSSSENSSDHSPPPTPHDMGGAPRHLPLHLPSSSKSSRGSSLSLGAAPQYRRRTEMNGHDPGLAPPGGGGTDPPPTSAFYPLLHHQTFLPPLPPTPGTYPIPLYPQVLYQYAPPQPPGPGPTLYTAPPHPAPLPPVRPASSCYNCGSQNHVAPECPDPTIDEVSKQGHYRLDYEGSGQFNMNSIPDNIN
uniref:Zinc finger CCHC domain-containing protein 2 n=1 Tax=Cacopsylla melanoneura TaxID=428564 RepID=A0A8D8M5A1_9HEMI